MLNEYKIELLAQKILENNSLSFECSENGDEITSEYYQTKNQNLEGVISFLNGQE